MCTCKVHTTVWLPAFSRAATIKSPRLQKFHHLSLTSPWLWSFSLTIAEFRDVSRNSRKVATLIIVMHCRSKTTGDGYLEFSCWFLGQLEKRHLLPKTTKVHVAEKSGFFHHRFAARLQCRQKKHHVNARFWTGFFLLLPSIVNILGVKKAKNGAINKVGMARDVFLQQRKMKLSYMYSST